MFATILLLSATALSSLPWHFPIWMGGRKAFHTQIPSWIGRAGRTFTIVFDRFSEFRSAPPSITGESLLDARINHSLTLNAKRPRTCIQVWSGIEDREYSIPKGELLRVSYNPVSGGRPALHLDPGHAFLRLSRPGYANFGGVESGLIRHPGVLDLPDGAVNQRNHFSGVILFHVLQFCVCRWPADAA